MIELTVFFQEVQARYAEDQTYVTLLYRFLHNYAPQIMGIFLFGLSLLCVKELYIDKITRNVYNKKKEGNVE